MRHFMICISGFSGAGKDECAAKLVSERAAVQTGLADPAKRHMADVYGFTEQQLFGPSAFRNAGDLRYPKNNQREMGLRPFNGPLPSEKDGLVLPVKKGIPEPLDPEARYWSYDGRDANGRAYVPAKLGHALFLVKEGDPEFWLSPREVLQQYCEKLNNFYLDTWVRKGVEDQLLLASGDYEYSRMGGVQKASRDWAAGMSQVFTCFADFRHIHECRYVRNAGGMTFRPVLVRVKRPSILVPPYDHRSETEQVKIRDAAFDAVLVNDKTVADLHAAIEEVAEMAVRGSLPERQWSDEYVIPNRKPEEGYAP